MNTRLFSAIVLTGAGLTGPAVTTVVIATGTAVSVAGCQHGSTGVVPAGTFGLGFFVDGDVDAGGCDGTCADLKPAVIDLGTSPIHDMGLPRFDDAGVTPHD